MSESLPLPPDLERLQVIRGWLEQQQARNEVIGIYLQVLREHVDTAIAAATPPTGSSQEYRIQGMRTPTGRSVLHRDDCWVTGGATITRDDALIAIGDPLIKPRLEMCDACQPEDGLDD